MSAKDKKRKAETKFKLKLKLPIFGLLWTALTGFMVYQCRFDLNAYWIGIFIVNFAVGIAALVFGIKGNVERWKIDR